MLSFQEYEAVRDQARSFAGVTAFSPFNPATLGDVLRQPQDAAGASGGAQPRPVLATLASCDYFEVLRVRAAAGRTLQPSDCAPGAPPSVVLSDRLWRAAFAADPAVVGRSVMLNRSPFVIVGVSQAGFTGTQLVPEDVVVPATLQKTIARDRDTAPVPRIAGTIDNARVGDDDVVSRTRRPTWNRCASGG